MSRKAVIYLADVEPLKNESVFSKLYSSLPEERKAKTDRLRFKKDKLLSVGAGALLKKALSDAGIEDAEFLTKKNQKPYLKNHPEIFFNLSHSGEKIMCIISDCEVGCDIEEIKENSKHIADRYFASEEQKQIESSDKKEEMFFRIWTLKESYIKALGLGLSLPLKDFSIVFGERISVIHNEENAEYSFFEFREIQGYCCSCCIKGNHNEPSIRVTDLGSLV